MQLLKFEQVFLSKVKIKKSLLVRIVKLFQKLALKLLIFFLYCNLLPSTTVKFSFELIYICSIVQIQIPM